MQFLINWIVSTLAIIITGYLLPGVKIEGFFVALVTALVLGLLNAVVKPILFILTLPINILTLGLFTFVLNALIIMLVSAIVPGFKVNGFLSALLFSLVLTIINFVLNPIRTIN